MLNTNASNLFLIILYFGFYQMKKTTKFRELIKSEKITIMPGVQDALTACIAAKTGFEVITCGGYSSTAALLGQPDTSQLTMIEMAEH